jgi:hypothetical protein
MNHQNDLEDMHYPNESNACEFIRYYIINVSIGCCIVQLNDMKYNLNMKVLHKIKIIQ